MMYVLKPVPLSYHSLGIALLYRSNYEFILTLEYIIVVVCRITGQINSVKTDPAGGRISGTLTLMQYRS